MTEIELYFGRRIRPELPGDKPGYLIISPNKLVGGLKGTKLVLYDTSSPGNLAEFLLKQGDVRLKFPNEHGVVVDQKEDGAIIAYEPLAEGERRNILNCIAGEWDRKTKSRPKR